MSTQARRFAVTIEAKEDSRSYVSNGQRVTVVPLTIKRRQNRKVLTPPPSSTSDATVGGFDESMIRTLGKGFHWQRQLDEGRYPHVSDLARKQKLERGWVSEILRMTLLAPDIITAIVEGRLGRSRCRRRRLRCRRLPHAWPAPADA